jgi:ribosomal protein L44E
MTNFRFTETAKEELDFECSECGCTKMPDLVDREDSNSILVDHIVTVSCPNCNNETKSNVWERDVEEY